MEVNITLTKKTSEVQVKQKIAVIQDAITKLNTPAGVGSFTPAGRAACSLMRASGHAQSAGTLTQPANCFSSARRGPRAASTAAAMPAPAFPAPTTTMRPMASSGSSSRPIRSDCPSTQSVSTTSRSEQTASTPACQISRRRDGVGPGSETFQESPALLPGLFFHRRAAIAQRQQGVAGHQARLAFQPTLVVIDPRAVRAAGGLEAPISRSFRSVVLDAFFIFDHLQAAGVQGLGKGLIVVVEPAAQCRSFRRTSPHSFHSTNVYTKRAAIA